MNGGGGFVEFIELLFKADGGGGGHGGGGAGGANAAAGGGGGIGGTISSLSKPFVTELISFSLSVMEEPFGSDFVKV